MQKHSSKTSKKLKDFETYFLILFTKELIRNTPTYKGLFVKQEVKSFVHKKQVQQSQQFPSRLPKRVLNKSLLNPKPKSTQVPFQNFLKQRTTEKFGSQKEKFSISESQLPPTFNYLKPTATSAEIDLKKLNSLIKDPMVQAIECNGPNEKLIVIGGMGRKNTSIVLNKEEINEVIRIFSEASKIPVSEGIFKVVVGKLILSAIISEVVDSKFVIKKMNFGSQVRV